MKRSRWLLIGKSCLAVGILLAVGWSFAKILRDPQLWEQLLTLRYDWLAVAGLLYLIPHTLWGTFFYWLLKAQGQQLSWFQGVRAYYVSQFGKYIPGKAMVLILRMLMLRGLHIPAVVVAVCATFETLASMGAGALLGVALLPWVGVDFGLDTWQYTALLLVGGSPLGLGLIVLSASRLTRRSRSEHARQLRSPPLWLLAGGLVFNSLGWLALGLSLWATLQAVSSEPVPLSFERYLTLLGTVSLAYVAGFVIVVSPGGLGPREFILQKTLTIQLGDAGAGLAVVVSLLLRFVWTLFEVSVAGLLWLLARSATRTARAATDDA